MVMILDGGMGQELVARAEGKPSPLWATDVMIDQPELVRAIHDDYFRAGAEIATVNSYAVLRDRLAPSGIEDRFEALHLAACRMAVEARDAHGSGLVAGSLGPLGASYRPDLAPKPEVAAEAYAEIAELQKPFVDMFICETMSSLDQARGAMMGAAVAGKPVWLAVTVDDDEGTRLRSGEAIEGVLDIVAEHRPAALLVNCSTPEAVTKALPVLAKAGVPLGPMPMDSPGFRMRSGAIAPLLTSSKAARISTLKPISLSRKDGWMRGRRSLADVVKSGRHISGCSRKG